MSKLAGLNVKVKAAIAQVPSTVTLYSKPTYNKATKTGVPDPSPLVVTNASVPYDFAQGFSGLGLASRPKSNVEVGDLGIVFPYDVAKTPEVGGEVLVGTVAWKIVGVDTPLQDATTVVAYICQLRR